MSQLKHLLCPVVWLGALALSSASASVITVDDDHPADFDTIQGAIDAASSGDVLRIAPGVYSRIAIDGKALTLLFEGSAALLQSGVAEPGDAPLIRISNLAASQAVVIDGMLVQNFLGGIPAAIQITGCDGPVWLQRGFVDAYGTGALLVESSHSVVVTDALLQTNVTMALPDGTPQPAPGGWIENALLRATNCTLRGSHGAFVLSGSPVPNAAADGGDGLRVVAGGALVEGGDLFGGSGSSFSGPCISGGSGGAGIRVDASAQGAVTLRDVDTHGGPQGFAEPGCGATPVAGPPISAAAGVVTNSLVPAKRLIIDGLLPAGGTTTIGLTGAGGDLALLFTAQRPAPAFTASGLWLDLDPASLILVAAVSLPTTSVALPVNIPPQLGGQGLQVPLQAVFVRPNNNATSSAPAMVVID